MEKTWKNLEKQGKTFQNTKLQTSNFPQVTNASVSPQVKSRPLRTQIQDISEQKGKVPMQTKCI
jgi:hypothetical protein